MKVDASESEYQEAPEAREEFSKRELKRLRFLLRRLRFLEMKARENEGKMDRSGQSVFADLEVESLEYVLTEIGFLAETADMTGARV